MHSLSPLTVLPLHPLYCWPTCAGGRQTLAKESTKRLYRAHCCCHHACTCLAYRKLACCCSAGCCLRRIDFHVEGKSTCSGHRRGYGEVWHELWPLHCGANPVLKLLTCSLFCLILLEKVQTESFVVHSLHVWGLECLPPCLTHSCLVHTSSTVVNLSTPNSCRC